MRDPERIDVMLGLLKLYWKNHPDLRLGQILANMKRGDLFFLQDDNALKILEAWNKVDEDSMQQWGRQEMDDVVHDLTVDTVNKMVKHGRLDKNICSCCGEPVDFVNDMGLCESCVLDGNCQ